MSGDPPEENAKVLTDEGGPERSDEGDGWEESARKAFDSRFGKAIVECYQAISGYLYVNTISLSGSNTQNECCGL